VVRRSAFTLIELIFAIVIIAISIMSLPLMTQATSRGMEGNIVQEAIFAASTELNQAVAANWDENSLLDGGANSLARVVPRNTGICNAATRLKPGHINQPLHRRCLNVETTAVSNASATAVDALNDYAGANAMSNAATSQSGYKFTYTTTIAVFHNSVTANSVIFDGVARNDMKRISVTVSNAGTTITTLNTYSANIGEVDYYKRTY